MPLLRTLASLALVAGLCVLTGCEKCSTITAQESDLDGEILWHTTAGDFIASPLQNEDKTMPVTYAGGVFNIYFDVPTVGSRALQIFGSDLEDAAPGTYPLDGMSAWIAAFVAGESTTEAPQQLFLKGTLEVRSIRRLYVDATFDISDSGETGPRGTFDIKSSSKSEESTCVRKSLF
jgi:hypothetical protein